MILPVAPDAPLVVRLAAGAALVLHIGGGTAGIGSGAVAMVAPKGGRTHRIAGTLFVVAMLTMSGVAAIVSPMMPQEQWTNTTAAIFTFYLVITSWVAVRRGQNEIGRFEPTAALVAAGLALEGLAFAIHQLAGGQPPGIAIYVFAGLAAMAAGGDIATIRAGGVAGQARVARHLWRMSLAMGVATMSFFVGQQKFLPEPVRGTLLVAIPPLLVVAGLVYWMVKLRWPRRRRMRPA